MAAARSSTVAVPEDAESKPKVTIAMEEEVLKKPEATQPLPIVPVQKWWEAECIVYAFVWPAVRARLERHMGSNLVRLTEKAYMRSLEDRIRRVNEENLARRIAAREQDEMERLKRLILCGKTPLRECPPELYHHPVFVFWRLVNEEVRLASKHRADAFYKKLKAFQGTSTLVLEDDLTLQSVKSEGQSVEVDSEALLEQCRLGVEEAKQIDMESGFIFSDDAYDSLKYEAENVKNLKMLTTVEELYHMADQIIGYPRVV